MFLPAAVNTALILSTLRSNFTLPDGEIDAYIIPYGGSHYDERVAACDARIKFVSGFGGSAGSVIISQDKALLWTDGRYFLEANQTLYDDWELMKEGEPGTPTMAQWLSTNVNHTTGRVGVAGSTYPKSSFDQMKLNLKTNGDITLVDTDDLVVKVWTDFPESPRPDCPREEVHDLPLNFSGKPVPDKLVDVRQLLTNEGADFVVISELDEVAWILNLRGSDMPEASIFFGFVIISGTTLDIFIDSNKMSNAIKTKLTTEYNGILHEYDEIDTVLRAKVATANKVWLSKYVNAKLANAVPEAKQFIKLSPVMLMKSKKNPVEVEGMRNAHLRDSAAIIALQSWLEKQLNDGVTSITELSASQHLYEIREKGDYFKGQSFTTIAGFGSNGAIIHYRPTVETNKNITKDGIFLLDSGGLYEDGTCDITRTMHFGTPSAEQKDRYTRVLKGHVAIALSTFPVKTVGARLDSFARKALWDIGLNYNHGTGHGIGHYLNVHEGPQRIGAGYSVDDSGLEENMFISNEPGFYKDGEYGIRIENIVRIAKSETLENFLKIETVSFVPLFKKLIDINLLTSEEIEWVDKYHQQCLEKVGKYIDEHDYIGTEVKEYLQRETSPLLEQKEDSGSAKLASLTFSSIMTMLIITKFLAF